MRYIARTHGVSVAWLHERFGTKDLQLVYELSASMCADIYTKAFTESEKCWSVCRLICVRDPAELKTLLSGVKGAENGVKSTTSGANTSGNHPRQSGGAGSRSSSLIANGGSSASGANAVVANGGTASGAHATQRLVLGSQLSIPTGVCDAIYKMLADEKWPEDPLSCMS